MCNVRTWSSEKGVYVGPCVKRTRSSETAYVGPCNVHDRLKKWTIIMCNVHGRLNNVSMSRLQHVLRT